MMAGGVDAGLWALAAAFVVAGLVFVAARARDTGTENKEPSAAYVRWKYEEKRRRRDHAVCAWCRRHFDKETREVFDHAPGWAPFYVSHGICDACADKVREEGGRSED